MPKKEVTKTVEKQVDRVVTVVRTVKPDGTVTEEKVVTDKSKIVKEDQLKLNVGRSKLSLSALAGTDLRSPVYGAHVSKEILGPVSVGIFGLTNGTFGASIGLNF
jgi:hypothetical protein